MLMSVLHVQPVHHFALTGGTSLCTDRRGMRAYQSGRVPFCGHLNLIVATPEHNAGVTAQPTDLRARLSSILKEGRKVMWVQW